MGVPIPGLQNRFDSKTPCTAEKRVYFKLTDWVRNIVGFKLTDRMGNGDCSKMTNMVEVD